MSSPISTILANLRHTVNILRSAVYAIDVRDDIADAIDDSADAIEQIYGDVNSASLREDAFAAALQEAIDDNLLPIPATVIGDNSLPGTKIQDGTIPLRKLSEAVQITVDSALSGTSTNPVQNKVIKETIDELNGSLEDMKYKLPVLDLYGDTSEMTKDVRSKLRYSWTDEETHTQKTGWVDAKWQGNSSLQFPKKNYTMRFFNDSKYKRKDNFSFFDMVEENKWVTKANYNDHSMARNIVAARLWADIVKSRKICDIPELLKNSPNYGAINGYPIIINLNGEFLGLYTLNIPKDDFTFGMDEENPLHCCAYGQQNNGGNKQTTSGAILSNEFRQASVDGWECEVPGAYTEDTQAGLIELINFVMTSTDEEFYENLNDYLDVESAIDYYLFCYFIGASDSLAKNMILLTYDGGSKWYCSAYDLDSTFGLSYNGANWFPYDYACPEDYGDNNNLLWIRLEENFGDELYIRYRELRSTVFSVPYVINAFENFMGQIPEEKYKADIKLWTKTPFKNVDHLNQIKTWITNRAPYVDNEIAGMVKTPILCTSVKILSDDDITISNDNDTHVLHAYAAPENTTESIVWSSSNTSIATVDEEGIVIFLTDGTVQITATCGTQTDAVSITHVTDVYNWTDTNDYGIDGDGNLISGNLYATQDFAPTELGVYKIESINGGVFAWKQMLGYSSLKVQNSVTSASGNIPLYLDAVDAVKYVRAVAQTNAKYPRGSVSRYLSISKSNRRWSYWKRYSISAVVGEVRNVGQNFVTPDYISVTAGGTYRIYGTPVGSETYNYFVVAEYDSSHNFIKTNSVTTATDVTVTLSENTSYVRLACACSVASNATNDLDLDSRITFTKVN